MPREISKGYEPLEIERHWAQAWFEEKLFRAETSGSGPVFSIVLPPPNVTGSIHIGHMLEHTQIDILVRWRRMRGFRTLWLPGIDHAGIATQVVVERELAKEGLTRQQLGREEFERRVWKWKAESGGAIKKQMIRLGASCDWTRERFTLDPPLYRAVLEAFLRLYREGLIYRGRYMVNWCPRCQTALSDLETIHQEREDFLWFLRYPLADSDDSLVVATTRPETMLGDTAVAVHPEDERYKDFVGRKVVLPLANREIPVIADRDVDPEFGTGSVKVTPAHDPNDFEIGRRHSLPEIDVITDDGAMSNQTGPYAGMNIEDARHRILEDLKERRLLDEARTKKLTHAVALCDRCKTVLEPRLSVQWFCKMKPLAEPALRAVHEGFIAVVPENQEKILLNWLDNIRDWCISRQLWWGHRIPVWHCADCGGMTPAHDSRVEIIEGRAQAASVPEKCAKCGSVKLTQDPDVLDTWFSSALWPFSTLGWPEETEDLRTFYPTSLLISGQDILFFWDARMIMMGLHLMPRKSTEERVPFRKLYLHALVRDPHGVKMSKTRGNVVDPLEVIENYGTDALRYTLTVMAAPGTDIVLSEDRILSYRAFANKIWNAARLVLSNAQKFQRAGVAASELLSPAWGSDFSPRSDDTQSASPADRWIFSRLFQVTQQVNDALENFRFHEAAHEIYHFFWGDFCDWYLEWVKPEVTASGMPTLSQLETWKRLVQLFSASLRLLHPFMPFLTEELWQRMSELAGREFRSLSLESFSVAGGDGRDFAAEKDFQLLQEIIVAARNIRAEMKLDPKRKVPADLSAADACVRELAKNHLNQVLRLAALSALNITSEKLAASSGLARSTARFELQIRFGEAVDATAEIARLNKEKRRLEKDLEAKRQRLADDDFRSRAPAEIVRGLETTLAERQAEYLKILDRLRQFE